MFLSYNAHVLFFHMYISHTLHQMAVNPHKRLSPTYNVKEENGDVFPVAEPLLGYVGVLGKEKIAL